MNGKTVSYKIRCNNNWTKDYNRESRKLWKTKEQHCLHGRYTTHDCRNKVEKANNVQNPKGTLLLLQHCPYHKQHFYSVNDDNIFMVKDCELEGKQEEEYSKAKNFNQIDIL